MVKRPDARQRAERAIALWNAEGVEAMAAEYWHPEIVWEEPPQFPDGAVRRGREECVRRMTERMTLLGAVTLELVDAEELVADVLLIEAIVHGRGVSSGAPTAMHEFFLMNTVGGQTVRFREFLDRESALQAHRAD